MKKGKTAGPDGIPPEFLHHLGPKGLQWLATLYSTILRTVRIPEIWHEAMVIAIPNPGKPPDEAGNYRPILYYV